MWYDNSGCEFAGLSALNPKDLIGRWAFFLACAANGFNKRTCACCLGRLAAVRRLAPVRRRQNTDTTCLTRNRELEASPHLIMSQRRYALDSMRWVRCELSRVFRYEFFSSRMPRATHRFTTVRLSCTLPSYCLKGFGGVGGDRSIVKLQRHSR